MSTNASILGGLDPQTVLDNICPYDTRNWFQFICFQNITNFQLDIVGFLAILGEGSVLANSQVATLSKITYLPRLLPAPQALMRPSRPSVLPSINGWTSGVLSGNHRDYVNNVGHTLVDGETLPPYSVRCVEIVRKHNQGEVKAKAFGPLWIVAILGFIQSVTLFALALWQNDGFALISVIALSGLSSLVGISNKWKLNLPKRNQGTLAPPGNVVIRYPKGSFLVIQCHEDVARELYFAPENIDYLVSQSWKYRIISLVGTFLLMVGVIALSNSSTWLQVGFAVSYMSLNAAYWVVAALPSKVHWDMSCFDVKNQCFEIDDETVVQSQSRGKEKAFIDHNKTFTQALYKVIVATKDIRWVTRSAAAPATRAWTEWLEEARVQAEGAGSHFKTCHGKEVKVWELPKKWDPQMELIRCMKEFADPNKV